MEKLIVGIDLCDTYTQAAVLGREEAWMLPTVICRKKSAEEWYVGEDAYKYTLVGEGVIVDKLLSLAAKEGTSTIGGVKYGGMELLQRFLGSILAMVRAEYTGQKIDELVISLKNLEMKLLEGLTASVEALGIPRGNVHIASHTECFVYYVLNQRRDVWGGQVGMFSLSDEDLRYYELKVTRGPRQMTAIAEHEELEEGFSLSVLDTGSGAKMADKILCACGERFLQKKIFSSIFLTGKGFARTDWAPEFMRQICNRRRVFVETAIFAKGAAMKAEDYLNESGSGSFVCLCAGYIWVKVPSLKPEREHWKIHGSDTRNQLAAGIPMAFQFAITASGTMIMQSAINLFGSVAVAAYTAAAKLQSLVIQGMIAMGQTMATYGGQNYGCGDVKRIRAGVRAALLAEFVYSIAVALLMCALLKPCLGLFFTGDVDISAMMPWAETYCHMTAAFFLPLCTIFIFRNIMQGCGYGFLPMMGGVSELIARLIVSVAAMKLFSYPLACFGDPAAWIAAASFTGISYLFVIKKIERELGKGE